jgi:splicing factor 3A subunit 1
VAKVGDDFEKKVIAQQAGQVKFAFLQPGNPYRKYYEQRIRDLREGRDESKPAMPQALLDFKKQEDEKKKRRDERKMLSDGLVKEYPPPPALLYELDRPYITAVDDDIIKITAQYVARNGGKFLQGLSQREGRNPQFDFLKPEHDLYAYFEALVHAYQKVLLPPDEELEKIKLFASSKEAILERITNRFMYMQQEDRKRADKAKEELELTTAMNRIDWQNFIIVDTLDFPADESVPLALPIDPKTGKTLITGAPVPLAADDAVISHDPTAGDVPDTVIEEEVIMEDESIPITAPPTGVPIRTDYVRQRKTMISEPELKSPITGEMVPESKFAEHMRVVLIDPKWKEQSEKVLRRAKESGSALAFDITSNLADFVKQRIELFGGDDAEDPAAKRAKQ